MEGGAHLDHDLTNLLSALAVKSTQEDGPHSYCDIVPKLIKETSALQGDVRAPHTERFT